MLPSEELEIVASGERAKTGAQWGRLGKGYLDSAGFWVNKFIEWGYTDSAFEPQFESFLDGIAKNNVLKAELLVAKSCKDVANIAKKYGYDVNGSVVLRYQAIQILKLDDEKAEQVAAGAD